MSNAYPEDAYRDPSNLCDTLRRLERMTNNCGGCALDGGKAWGRQVCNSGKRPDKDGWCRHWRKKQ